MFFVFVLFIAELRFCLVWAGEERAPPHSMYETAITSLLSRGFGGGVEYPLQGYTCCWWWARCARWRSGVVVRTPQERQSVKGKRSMRNDLETVASACRPFGISGADARLPTTPTRGLVLTRGGCLDERVMAVAETNPSHYYKIK